MMQRRHHEAAVKLIHDAVADVREADHGLQNTLAYYFANFFQADNPRFDREKFLGTVYGRTGIRGGKKK